MKTAMGLEKAKVWISENLGTRMATRLFRGLALGVLLVAATGVYFSINQGEAGSPLGSEEKGVAATVSDLNDYAQVPLLGLDQGKVDSSASSGRIQCYPEDNVVCLYNPFGPSSTGNLLVTDQNEVRPEIEDTSISHLMKQLKAGSPPSINGIRCYPEDDC